MRENTKTFIGNPCKHGHDGTRYVKTRLCVECTHRRSRNHYEKNREYRIEKQKEWLANNPEKAAEWHKKRKKVHYQNNKEVYLSYVHKRRAKIAENGGSYTVSDIQTLFSNQKGFCNICNCHLTSFEIDHIVPISKGGSNNPDNLQLLCRSCNRKKGNK